jgi:hypothetical protein
MLLASVMGFFMVMVALVSMNLSLFKAEDYRALVTVKTETKLDKHLPGLNLRNAPLVSSDMAMLSASKKLSEVPSLGSQVELGSPAKQLVNGKLVWVMFMEHSGLFKWWGNDTTPGYVVVSATDPSDVQLVTKLNGNPMKLRYMDSAYFGENAQRHAYFNGYAGKGVADWTPELDEAGKPYLVGSVYMKTLGLFGQTVTGVVVMDSETGAMQEYSVEDAPDWIDRIQPAHFVEEHLADWGDLVHGWFNWANKDKLTISGTPDLVYNNGKAYYYVGITSVGKDDGVTGFMLVDSRTKAATYFVQPGVIETTAQAIVQQAMPEKNYIATNALPFVVNGEVVYVASLQDSNGIARAYGLVSLNDFQKMAVAETLSDAYRLYTSKVSGKASLDLEASAAKLSGKVARFVAEVKGGATYYYLMLEGSKKVYIGGTGLGETLALTRPGDTVGLSVQELDTARGTVNILVFRNKSL